MTVPAPATVRQAAVLVTLEGAVALIVAVVYLVSGFGDAEEGGLNKFGTAAWFVIVGGGVLAGGWALWSGRRWGRGVAVFAQLLLLPVAWYVTVGSHQWLYGIPIALVAVLTLVLLFSPSALQWAAAAQDSGPDTR